MTHLITAQNGSGTTAPLAVAGYEADRDSRNVIHDLLDGTLGVSFVTPRPRSGNLVLVFDGESAAWAAHALHAQPTRFQYVNTEHPAVGMVYVLDGRLGIAEDDEVENVWLVTVGYQEVSA